MSQHLGYGQVLAAVLLSAGCLSEGVGATPRNRTSGEGEPVVLVGAYSNVRYTDDHAYGQQVHLWRQGERLVGLFLFTDGRPSDFDTGLLEKVRFSAATRRLAFETYASQFRFEGTLERNAVSGLLTRMHPATGAQVSAERVVLKRNAELTNLLQDYPSLDEWTRNAEAILKRLGPPGKRPLPKQGELRTGENTEPGPSAVWSTSDSCVNPEGPVMTSLIVPAASSSSHRPALRAIFSTGINPKYRTVLSVRSPTVRLSAMTK